MQQINNLIKKYTLQENLATYDPYDIWKTKLGFFVKNGFNKNKYLFIIPAALLTIFDIFINNKIRIFYKKQEYPIVRAFATLSLLDLYKKDPKQEYLDFAKKHIDWLIRNRAIYKNGFGWGIGFYWNISKDIVFTKNTPLSTHTPYGLEAIYELYKITKDKRYLKYINEIFDFFENDINILYNKNNSLAISYGPFGNFIVNNATSYALFSYSIFYNIIPQQKEYIKNKIIKFYNFLKYTQRTDASWLYAPFEKNSFIDCFHSAIIVKNIIKTKKNIDFDLENSNEIINNAYAYIKKSFFIEKKQLFKRFSLSNKPGITKFDLYDNAEMLNLAILMNDYELVKILKKSINDKFIKNDNVYSVIDLFNIKRNKNTLRWAVMPYVHAISNINK
jgi:hypothetical protein